MSLQQKVSSAIRILRWNRDVSARASHLVEVIHNFQAGSGNVSGSTVFFERKLMSTKTSIKRIAAVAAVALTLGGFSAVSAHATVATATFVTTAGTNTAGVASIADTATATADGAHYVAVTLSASSADTAYVITTAGVGSLYGSASESGTATIGYTNGANAAAGISWSSGVGAFASTPFTTAQSLYFTALSSASGTQTITATPVNGSSAASTLTITWGAAPAFSVGLSTSVLSAGTYWHPAVSTTDDVVSAPKAATTGQVAVAMVTVNDGSAAAYKGVALSAVVSGPGLVSASNSTSTIALGTGTYARIASLTATAQAATNVGYFAIASDGTAGVGTITISGTDPVSGVTSVLATETVTFVGSVATVKAVGNLKVLRANSTANFSGSGTATDAANIAGTIALTGFAVDSLGNPTNAAVVKAVSSDSTILAPSTCVPATGGDSVIGEYNCPVAGVVGAASGKTATVTFEAQDSAGNYTILATPVTFAIGGSITKEVLATDSSSYTPLAPMKLTVTATDASGNPTYDHDAVLVASAVSSIQLGGTALTDATSGLYMSAAIVNGVASYKGFYAPAAEGDFTISGTDTLTALNAISATSTVGAGAAAAAAQAAVDAAQEATDAANAAYDAANNAMDSADAATAAAQDASDNASAALAAVTSLSATVAKLVASVTAIATALASIKKKLGVK